MIGRETNGLMTTRDGIRIVRFDFNPQTVLRAGLVAGVHIGAELHLLGHQQLQPASLHDDKHDPKIFHDNLLRAHVRSPYRGSSMGVREMLREILYLGVVWCLCEKPPPPLSLLLP